MKDFNEEVWSSYAEKIFSQAFPGKEWPKGWRFKGVNDLPNAFALTIFDDKLVKVCLTALKHTPESLLDTIIHELIHVIHGHELKHGPRFYALLREAKKRRILFLTKKEKKR